MLLKAALQMQRMVAAVEAECPFSAIQIYLRDRKRLYVFDLPEDTGKWNKIILRNLFNTNYGRCVYRMDNDQPDHLTVNMQFDKNITASFLWKRLLLMKSALHVSWHERRYLLATWKPILLLDFKSGRETSWSLKQIIMAAAIIVNAGLGAGVGHQKPANTFFYN